MQSVPPASFPPSLQCLEFLPISWPSLKSQTVSFLEYSPPPPAPLCPDHIYSISTQPGQSIVGLCPNSLHHGYSCDNITYVFRSHNKPYLKQWGDQRQLCPATMVSQMPSRERGSWVSHGRNSTTISLIHFRCLAAACTISPALLSSCPTSYSASPLHRAPHLQPVAQFYHSSLDRVDMKGRSPWTGESKVSVEDRDPFANSPIAPEQTYLSF